MTLLSERTAAAGVPHTTHNYWLLTPRQSFWNSLSLMINTRELGDGRFSAQLCRTEQLATAFGAVILHVRASFSICLFNPLLYLTVTVK